MKISVPALAEAISLTGKCKMIPENSTACYSYPLTFDGAAGARGHVILLSNGEASDKTSVELSGGSSAELSDSSGNLCIIADSPSEKSKIAEHLNRLYDRLERWDDRLSSCSCDLQGISRMLDISAREMEGDLVLIDVSYNIPAFTETGASDITSLVDKLNKRATEQAVSGLAEDPKIASARALKGVQLYESDIRAYGAPSTLYRNMFRKGENNYFNRLLFLRLSGKYSALDRLMLEHLAEKIERITEHLSTFAVPLTDYLGLKQQLLRVSDPSFRPDSSTMGVLSPLKWEAYDTYQFFIFRSLYQTRDAGISEYIIRNLEKLLPCSFGADDGERILLIRNSSRSDIPFSSLRSSLADFLRENLYKTGISNEFHSFSQLRGAFLQAEAALSFGSSKDPMFWYYQFEDYLGDYILRQASSEIPPDMLVLPALARLIRHDKEKGTSYSETLRILAEENYNYSRASKRLFIHRSTLQDRLERLHQLVDIDLDDETVRAMLWVGFRI